MSILTTDEIWGEPHPPWHKHTCEWCEEVFDCGDSICRTQRYNICGDCFKRKVVDKMPLSKGMEDLGRDPKRIKEEGLRLLDIIKSYNLERMYPRDRNFVESMLGRLDDVKYVEKFNLTERQVTWLRDIKDRYL